MLPATRVSSQVNLVVPGRTFFPLLVHVKNRAACNANRPKGKSTNFKAISLLQATEGIEGTDLAAESDGKKDSKILL